MDIKCVMRGWAKDVGDFYLLLVDANLEYEIIKGHFDGVKYTIDKCLHLPKQIIILSLL